MGKLNNSTISIICKAISKGSTYKQAAEYAQIDESTFYSWKKKGEKAKSGKYRQFYQSLKRANANAYMIHLNRINHASATGNTIRTKRTHHHPDGTKTVVIEEKQLAPVWQASAWILERRFPEDFNKNRDTDVEDNLPLPWCDGPDDWPDPLGKL